MILRTRQANLRPWEAEDAATLAHYANNIKIARNLRDGFPHPYSIENAQFYIKSVTDAHQNLIFAIEVDKKPVGSIGIFPKTDIYRRNAEIGYWLAEDYWGRGIATEVVEKMATYCFAHTEVHRLYANVFEPNMASKRVLEKCGFTLEAVLQNSIIKNNQVMDEHVYVRFRE